MPLRKRNNKKYLIWAIIIGLILLMIVSIPNHPEFTEIVLYP